LIEQAGISIAGEAGEPAGRRESLWSKGLYKFRRDRAGLVALAVVLAYFVAAAGVWLGVWATGWSDVEGGKWEGPSAAHWFGTNVIGQDIFDRAIYSTKTAFEVGLVVAVLSTARSANIRSNTPACDQRTKLSYSVLWGP